MIAVLIILVIEYSRGNELKTETIVPMLAMIYLLFFSINIITYFGLSSLQQFLAIVERLAGVFKMEENLVTRQTDVKPEDVCVEVENASYSWGFRVKDDQGGAQRGKVLIESEDKTIISDVNFSLKHNDLMVVVGMVGSGKTTLLHSLMEETRRITGTQTIKGTMSYVE